MDDGSRPAKARVVGGGGERRACSGGERLLAGFVDVAGVGEVGARAARGAFPTHFMHAFAAKAGCLEGILRLVRGRRHGLRGGEPGELAQAMRAGFAPGRIVFDSPAKTWGEIRPASARA